MARGVCGPGSRPQAEAAKKNGILGVVALLAVVGFGGVLGSGCAGLANTPNAAATGAVQISPAEITFPNVSVGQKTTQTATLTNTSSEAVTLTQLSSTASQFVASGLHFPLTIGPGQSTRFQIVFTGSTSGTTSGTITAMELHGRGTGHVKLQASASASTPQLSISTSSLNFGNVLLNGSSTQAVTLSNPGLSDVQISQIQVAGAGYSVSGVAAPVTISAGQAMALQATFAPTAAGGAAGSITISSNAQNPTVTITLNGTATATTYTMSLTPGSVSFGNVNVGSSTTQNLQLSNTGNSSVTVTQVVASGAGVSVSGLSMPVTLAPSQSAAMTVQYAPTATGAVSGSITVTNNDGISTVAAVTGTGAQAALSVTPSSASFGSVATGSANTQTVQVKNSGNANLTISQATVTGSGFSLSGISAPMTLTPGQSSNFTVQYAPTSAGSTSGSVSVMSNAPNSPAAVALSGTGVASTQSISVSPSSLSFGSVNDGSSATQSFTVTNTGNSNVAISGMSASGSGYSITSGGGAVTLSPNQSMAVSVQFAPSAAGAANGSVSIASNASGSPAAVGLSGTGVAPQTPHSVALNWSASTSSVAGYNVYRSSVSGGSYVRMNGSLVAGVSYADGSVTSGQTYYYVATSVDSSGNESVYSNEVSATIP